MLPLLLTIAERDDRDYVCKEYEKHKVKLYVLANQILNHPNDSEDCVQDVIVVLIDYLEAYKTWSYSHQIAFLVRCCRSIAINKYHKKKRQRKHEISLSCVKEELLADDEDIPAYVANLDSIDRLKKVIDEMDPKYGDVLYFKAFLQMKNEEIASMLGISTNLVSVRLRRARALLCKSEKGEHDAVSGK